MPTDITERGLESLIVDSLITEAGYVQGDPKDYDGSCLTGFAGRSRTLSAEVPFPIPYY
ncbi:hypothetical protein ACFL2Q_08190 [Thermodesulfobacteriota bacterium]